MCEGKLDANKFFTLLPSSKINTVSSNSIAMRIFNIFLMNLQSFQCDTTIHHLSSHTISLTVFPGGWAWQASSDRQIERLNDCLTDKQVLGIKYVLLCCDRTRGTISHYKYIISLRYTFLSAGQTAPQCKSPRISAAKAKCISIRPSVSPCLVRQASKWNGAMCQWTNR